MNTKRYKSVKTHLFCDHIFGAIFTLLHISLAYLGGNVVLNHVINVFSPNCVLTIEAPCIAGGILVVVLGIFGSYGALYFVFHGTKLERVFPGYWG